MTFFIPAVLFVLGLFFIIRGGGVLVHAALKLNQITGVNQVIIGATFVSVATTLPEVFVSIFAVAAGNHGIAIGNAVGAMLANIALVLAISLIFLPQGIKRGEVTAKSIFLLAVTLLVFLFALNLKFSWYEGVILLIALVVFLLLNVREARNGTARNTQGERPMLLESTPTAVRGGTSRDYLRIALGFIFGQLMLITGAFVIVENGEILAHLLGISETVVGFTVIAIGTSLPELTTAVMGIRRGGAGLAVGNVIGANVINCTLLLGVCGIIGDIRGDSFPISRETVFIALPVLFILTLLAVVPMLIRGRGSRWQGVALLSIYAAYVAYLVVAQPA